MFQPLGRGNIMVSLSIAPRPDPKSTRRQLGFSEEKIEKIIGNDCAPLLYTYLNNFLPLEEENHGSSKKETQTERGIYETGTAGCRPQRSRRHQGDTAHRGDQETLGLHQKERAP